MKRAAKKIKGLLSMFYVPFHEIRKPPNVCPKSMFGLYSAVAKMNPPNMDPIPVKIAMYFTFWHGMKNAANALTGLAIALNVTAK